MNKTKKLVLGLGVMALTLGISGAIASTTSAYRRDPGLKGPNYSIERHAAMEKAFEANDYLSWKNLMQDKGRVTQIINKDNFAKFAEAHELAEKGDLEGARKIRQELGLGLKDGSGQGMRSGFGKGANMGNHINR
jgi:hypothetical protein